jgi:hypothetical protein
MYSLLFRGLHDLDLNAGNWGVFTRVKWWYDYEQANGDVLHGHAANDYAAGEELEHVGISGSRAGQGHRVPRLLPLGQFDIGEMPLELRAGTWC